MKIKDIYIRSFRGIPNELSVDFTNKRGVPVSTVIYGDNGSGKSSIVDALEFNLQGRILREPLIITSESKTPISYVYTPIIGCNTIVTLENNSKNMRGIDVRVSQKKTSCSVDNTILCADFSLTPIVLRRNDIISFGIIPKESRQILFFSFLYQQFIKLEEVVKNSVHWEGDQYILSIKDEYVNLKQQRKENIRKLAEVLNVKSMQIPYGEPEKLNGFINSHLNLKGFSKKRNKLKSIYFDKLTIPEKRAIAITKEINKLTQKIKKVKETAEKALNPNIYGITIQKRREKNARFIKTASQYLSEAFKAISTLDFIDSIELEIGDYTSASLEIVVRLKNGKVSTPNQLFSEANYDLMVLLLYFSLIRASVDMGQSKVIILDDVFQSVDSIIRARFMDYLLSKCKDWQFIITCHDELWLNQLRFLFNKNGVEVKEYKLCNWTFENGPKLIEVTNASYDNSLSEAISTNNKQIIASQSGIYFENICQKLSISLSISIHRTPNDKYTIGDLWPGIKKALKSSQELMTLFDEVDRGHMVRNMLGCHANDWALGMSDIEVINFAEKVQELYDKVFCKKCLTWISNKNCSGNYIAECNCREIQYKKLL